MLLYNVIGRLAGLEKLHHSNLKSGIIYEDTPHGRLALRQEA